MTCSCRLVRLTARVPTYFSKLNDGTKSKSGLLFYFSELSQQQKSSMKMKLYSLHLPALLLLNSFKVTYLRERLL